MPARFYKTVSFNNVEICAALGCAIEYDGFDMEPPELIETWVSVPGRIDGPIDMTESLAGYPTFGTRTMNIHFIAKAKGREAGEKLLSAAQGMLHGKRGTIQLGWDPGYTYEGRVTVGTLVRNRDVAGFTMTAKCEPYKFKRHVTVSRNVAGGMWLELESGDAPVCPIWTASSKVELHQDGSPIYYELGKGVYRLPDIVLRKGTNRIYAYARGTGGTPTTIGDFENDTISDLTGSIADWLWEEDDKPTGGQITVEYDWKDL